MNITSYYFKLIPELHDYVDFAFYYEGDHSFYPDRMIPTTIEPIACSMAGLGKVKVQEIMISIINNQYQLP